MNLISLLAPETCIAVLGTIAFLFVFMPEKTSQKIIYPVMLVLSALAVLSSICAFDARGLLCFQTYELTAFSQAFKIILAASLFSIIAISDHTPSLSQDTKPEYFLFLSTATLGMMMMVSSAELITLFLSLELASVSQYILVPIRKGKVLNAEAGIKYLLFGAAASALTLYGLSFIFGIAQTTFLSGIASQIPVLLKEPVFYVGVFLTGAGFFFKLASFPFHFWAPDVYEAASTQVTAFIATASKAAAVAVLIKLISVFAPDREAFSMMLIWLSIISMTLGNLAAIIQKDMKRMLAYSSVAQAGYLLTGLLSETTDGNIAVVFYTISYLVMNFAAFLVTVRIAGADDNPGIKSFAGLAERSPILALTLMISLLSLAGIPPLAGFTGKWFLFSAAMAKGHWALVLTGVINSVISLYYYLMVVKESYLSEAPKDAPALSPSIKTKVLSYISVAAIILLGIFPSHLVKWIEMLFKA